MAYTTATVKAIDQNDNGTITVYIVYTGDAKEIVVTRAITLSLTAAPDSNYLRSIAVHQLDMLNINKGIFIDLFGKIPFVLDTTTPLE